MFSPTPGLAVPEVRSNETPKSSWMLEPCIIYLSKQQRTLTRNLKGTCIFGARGRELMEGGGWSPAEKEEKEHDKVKQRLAQLQPVEEGCGEDEQLGSLCQNECSSFPNPFAATWPCPLPCADPSTHLRSVRTDAGQEHGTRKGEGLEGRAVTLEETCPEWWHRKEQPSWDTKVSIQQMTPHLKQEAHFPPQPVRKNRLLTTWEHPLHLFF